MRARQTLYAWDYHHGQATRVILGGLPHLPGDTMLQKQQVFIRDWDHVRTSLMQEPRGHKNMLGAVVTAPATTDGDFGLLFLSPQGFFDMCGDSTFSAVAALVDSGMAVYDDPDGEITIKLDTVAGRVDVRVALRRGEPVRITFANVASYDLGDVALDIPGLGQVRAMLGYGGLNYAFVEARSIGIKSLNDTLRDELLDVGTKVWRAARSSIHLPASVSPESAGNVRPVDLITLWEPLEGENGARVANFYAPHTCGRTPSGTGLSARAAIEAARGRLSPEVTFIHESLLGLRFTASPLDVDVASPPGYPSGCIPAITARSFLMGVSQWVIHPEDPFGSGFVF